MSLSSLTLLLLALVTAALLLVRRIWGGLRTHTRRSMVLAALLAIALFGIGRATSWSTTSDRANCGFYWLAVIGYLFLLTIHSLNRPRWLNSATAIVLALPIFAASFFLPLGTIFHPPPRRFQPLGDNLYVSWQRFVERGTPSTGVDLEVLYRPPLLPFLQHVRLAGRFYNLQCDAAATSVVLQPDHESVLVRCPPWPSPGGALEVIGAGGLLRLRR